MVRRHFEDWHVNQHHKILHDNVARRIDVSLKQENRYVLRYVDQCFHLLNNCECLCPKIDNGKIFDNKVKSIV